MSYKQGQLIKCQLCDKLFVARSERSIGCTVAHQKYIGAKVRLNKAKMFLPSLKDTSKYMTNLYDQKDTEQRIINLYFNSSIEAFTEAYKMLRM